MGILAEKDEIKDVYFLRGLAGRLFMDKFNDDENLKKEGYVVITSDHLNIVQLATKEAFLTFRTNGLDTFKGHSFAKVENVRFHTGTWKDLEAITYKQQDIERISGISMHSIKGNIKIPQCR